MNTSSLSPKAKWIKPMAKAGLIAKGSVYCLTGLMTLLALLSIGDSKTGDADKGGVFKMVHEQPLGKVLLAIIAVGLLCYAIWRIIMAIKNTEDKDDDAKGIGTRIVYLFSGLVYLSLFGIALRLVLHNKKSSGNSRQQLASELLDKPWGIWLVAIVAFGMVAVGIVQIYRAVSGKYKKYVQRAHFSNQSHQSLLIKAGMAGYIARGIVWLIVGWLFLKAAINSNAREAGDMGSAFQWLRDSAYGDILLAVVSLGLVCYGVFMFLRARYQPIHTS